MAKSLSNSLSRRNRLRSRRRLLVGEQLLVEVPVLLLELRPAASGGGPGAALTWHNGVRRGSSTAHAPASATQTVLPHRRPAVAAPGTPPAPGTPQIAIPSWIVVICFWGEIRQEGAEKVRKRRRRHRGLLGQFAAGFCDRPWKDPAPACKPEPRYCTDTSAPSPRTEPKERPDDPCEERYGRS